MNGEKIKQLRVKLYMTQREFAKEIGVHWVTVCQWEKEEKRPSLRNQKKMVELATKNGIEF